REAGDGGYPPRNDRPDGGGRGPLLRPDGGPGDPQDPERPRGDAGDDGGYFEVPEDPTDPEAVCEVMLDASKEFVFDIQTHHVNRANTLYTNFLRDQMQFTGYCGPMGIAAVDCF